MRLLFIFCFLSVCIFAEEHIYLRTPDFSNHRVIKASLGRRPCRKNGIRIETEKLGNQIVIHNYGYGGSGMSLAFGGAHIIVDEIEKLKINPKKIAVLGAGIAGLSVAYDLLDRGYEVAIYADQWSPDLISNIALGIWSPIDWNQSYTNNQNLLHKAIEYFAIKRLSKSLSDTPEFFGVRMLPYFRLLPKEINTEHCFKYKDSESVVVHFDNGLVRPASKSVKLSIDSSKLMEDLFCKVKEKGAQLSNRYFSNKEQLQELDETVIVNCLGIGAREVFLDDEMYEVKGHLIYLEAQPGIDYVLSSPIPSSPYFFSMNSWENRLAIGGSLIDLDEEEVSMREFEQLILEHATMITSPSENDN